MGGKRRDALAFRHGRAPGHARDDDRLCLLYTSLLPAPDIVPCTIMQRAIYNTSPSACKKALFSEWVRTAARYHPGHRPG